MYILTLQHAIGFSLKWLVRRVLPWAERKKMFQTSVSNMQKEKTVLRSTKKKKQDPEKKKMRQGAGTIL